MNTEKTEKCKLKFILNVRHIYKKKIKKKKEIDKLLKSLFRKFKIEWALNN